MRFAVTAAVLALNLSLVSALYIPRVARGTQFITGACNSDSDCAAGCCGFNTGKCAGAVVALTRDGGCGHGDAVSNDNAARKLGFTGSFTPSGKGGGGAAPAPAAGGGGGNTVTVKSGDTCSTLASSHGTTTGALVAANPGVNAGCTNLQVGQVLKLAGGGGGAPAPANKSGSGKAAGTQFITGPCANDGDCASGCCGFRTGKCAGSIIALSRDGGCGHGDAKSNDTAGRKLGFKGAFTPSSA